MTQQIEISMPYFRDLSVNHYKFGHFTKNSAKAWREDLAQCIYNSYSLQNNNHPPEVREVAVHLEGTFRDKRSSPDLHNLAKIIMDATEDALGINDKYIAFSCGIPQVEKKDYGIYWFKRGRGKDGVEAKGELKITVRIGN